MGFNPSMPWTSRKDRAYERLLETYGLDNSLLELISFTLSNSNLVEVGERLLSSWTHSRRRLTRAL
jgi:hypothetical protein